MFGATCLLAAANAADRVAIYAFLVECNVQDSQGLPYTQSFVAEVSDIGIAGNIRDIINGAAPPRLGVFEIAAGGGGILVANKNFHTSSQAPWSWHVLQVVELLDITNLRLPASDPKYASSPADIEKDPPAWIAANGNQYAPLSGRFTMEFGRDGTTTKLVNISDRGVCGMGDRSLIAGFVIEGSEPRRVLIRGLGPTLLNFGVQDFVMDPAVRLFSGSTSIAYNDNWREGQSIVPFLELSLGLTSGLNDREAALVVTLPPGAYTVQLESHQEAIGLLEVYDVTAL